MRRYIPLRFHFCHTDTNDMLCTTSINIHTIRGECTRPRLKNCVQYLQYVTRKTFWFDRRSSIPHWFPIAHYFMIVVVIFQFFLSDVVYMYVLLLYLCRQLHYSRLKRYRIDSIRFIKTFLWVQNIGTRPRRHRRYDRNIVKGNTN